MADYSKLIDRLTVAKDLGPADRDINYKGRIRQVFSVIGKNFSGITGVNLLLIFFCLPIIGLLIIYLPIAEQNLIAKEMLNFSGGIGIGYGVVDQTARGIEIIYNTRIKFFAYFFIPCMMFAGIGFAGAYHCARNYLWGAKTKVIKHFFRGVARHWWKFLITFTFLGGVGASVACSLCYVLRDMAITGSANAGLWVWLVASCIIALLSLAYCILAMPTYVQYNFTFGQNIKNTLLLSPQVILPTLFILVAVGAPLALFSVKFLGYLLAMFFAIFGLVMYVLFDLAYGQYVNDNFVQAVYEAQEAQKKKEKAKEQKRQNVAKKKAKQTRNKK